MLRGMRLRVELTTDQAVLAGEVAGVCRTVWNTGLDLYRHYNQANIGKAPVDRRYIGYVQIAKEMADARAEVDWLAAAPSMAMQQTLRDLDQTIRKHGPWKTRFRGKSTWTPSFRFPEGDRVRITMLNGKWATINLPKFGEVKFRHTRMIGGTIRSSTMAKDARHWYVSVLVEDGVQAPAWHPGGVVGVDRGVKILAALSDGQVLHPVKPFVTAGEQQRIRRLQRHLARQREGSNRRAVTKAKIAATSAKGRRRRQDWAAQAGHQLAEQFSVVVFEDLKIKNMTKRAAPKPDPDRPGQFLRNNRRQKSGLNKAILNAGWGALKLATANAARRTGTRVLTVPAAFSSQECAKCHHIDHQSRESQAVFHCTNSNCEARAIDADLNAAQVVLHRGLQLLSLEHTDGLAVSGRGDLQDCSVSTNRSLQPAA